MIYLLQAYVRLAADQFERFPTLKRNVIGQVGSQFQKRCNAAAEAIETMMSMEDWIYTRDSVYQNVMTDVSSEGAAGHCLQPCLSLPLECNCLF